MRVIFSSLLIFLVVAAIASSILFACRVGVISDKRSRTASQLNNVQTAVFAYNASVSANPVASNNASLINLLDWP